MIEASQTEFYKAISKAHGFELYGRYLESDAAQYLGVSTMTLRRIRTTQRIAHIRVSARKIYYFGYQLVEFLLQSVESQRCQNTKLNTHSSSETIGSPNNRVAPHGVAHGSTQSVDKHAALACAQRILKKPNNA